MDRDASLASTQFAKCTQAATRESERGKRAAEQEGGRAVERGRWSEILSEWSSKAVAEAETEGERGGAVAGQSARWQQLQLRSK